MRTSIFTSALRLSKGKKRSSRLLGREVLSCKFVCVFFMSALLSIYDLTTWHSTRAVFCGSKSREGLICDDMYRRLVYSPQNFGWSFDFVSLATQEISSSYH